MSPRAAWARVYQYCDRHWGDGRKSIVDHFRKEGIAQKTVYTIIKGWENGLDTERKKGSGRKPVIMTKRKIDQLAVMIDNRTGISTRQLAKKFKCDQSYIVKTIKKKTTIVNRKRILKADRTPAQQAAMRPRCSRILKKFRGREFVLDDESYFTFKNSDKNANAGFWSSDPGNAPDHVKFKTKKKFEPKILVWLAISPRGISKPFFATRGLAVDQKVYLHDCIIDKLIPFIRQYHSDDNYVFWPDLASSHYANSVIAHLRQENVHFVEKGDNPPCVPELRPIENFWSILKGYVYANGWEATGDDADKKLKQRIRLCLKKIDMSVIHDMVSGVSTKLDTVRRTGNI